MVAGRKIIGSVASSQFQVARIRTAERLKAENPLSAVKTVLGPSSKTMNPSFEEQFFVPTLRVQVPRYWS
ncbi:hypothetical protein, partial [Mesotoga prima]|uniref:hypothetical protein n=1 Tax=Mesotoga prima TaxID=1184387 RepID=UPI002FD8CE6B